MNVTPKTEQDYNRTQLALDEHTLHVPMNFIFQRNSEGRVTGVVQFQMEGNPIDELFSMVDDAECHMLIQSDVLIRPHLIAVTKEHRGYGISSLYRQGFSDLSGWLKEKSDKVRLLYMRNV